MVCGMSSSNASKLPLQNGVSASKVGIPANTHLSAIEFLIQRFPAIQRDVWLQRFEAGHILNAQGQSIAPAHGLLGESHLQYFRQVVDEPSLPFKAQIIFQDDYLVVADKPHFMPVTPAGRYVRSSLLVQLKEELGIDTLSPLHRIDRETAGLVVLSVNPQERNAYQALFRERQVHKTYLAIGPYRNELVFPLTRQSRIEEDAQFFLSREAEGAPNSETHIEILKCLDTGLNPSVHPSDDSTEGSTRRSPQSHYRPKALYQLSPITGKRHQLRIHMCALGIPIEGDQFYPEVLRGPDEREDFSQPLQLLAQKIAFTDPISGEKREFISKQKLVWMS